MTEMIHELGRELTVFGRSGGVFTDFGLEPFSAIRENVCKMQSGVPSSFRDAFRIINLLLLGILTRVR